MLEFLAGGRKNAFRVPHPLSHNHLPAEADNPPPKKKSPPPPKKAKSEQKNADFYRFWSGAD